MANDISDEIIDIICEGLKQKEEKVQDIFWSMISKGAFQKWSKEEGEF